MSHVLVDPHLYIHGTSMPSVRSGFPTDNLHFITLMMKLTDISSVYTTLRIHFVSSYSSQSLGSPSLLIYFSQLSLCGTQVQYKILVNF